jgi:ribonuclease P protein component
MLPKNKRLTHKEFDIHFKKGKRFHGTALQLIISPSPTFHGAIVVGKKVYQRAVDRNKVRRSLYPVLSEYKSTKYVCIVIAKPPLKNIPLANVRAELRTLLHAL